MLRIKGQWARLTCWNNTTRPVCVCGCQTQKQMTSVHYISFDDSHRHFWCGNDRSSQSSLWSRIKFIANKVPHQYTCTSQCRCLDTNSRQCSWKMWSRCCSLVRLNVYCVVNYRYKLHTVTLCAGWREYHAAARRHRHTEWATVSTECISPVHHQHTFG